MNRCILYLSLLVFSGCAMVPPQSLRDSDASTRQAIVVHPLKPHAIQACLSAWQKQGSSWHRLFLVRAVIGRNGLAPIGEKKEGDGRTPSGTYALGPAFGYEPSIDTGLAYRQATDDDFWVDDMHSMQYNQWVHGKPQAQSFERLKRDDGLYRYAVVIGYNMHPIVPGAGSAIFMHIWRAFNSPTSGCVALDPRKLRRILRWLDAKAQPIIILE